MRKHQQLHKNASLLFFIFGLAAIMLCFFGILGEEASEIVESVFLTLGLALIILLIVLLALSSSIRCAYCGKMSDRSSQESLKKKYPFDYNKVCTSCIAILEEQWKKDFAVSQKKQLIGILFKKDIDNGQNYWRWN